MKQIATIFSLLILTSKPLYAYELPAGLSRSTYDVNGHSLSVIEGGPESGEPVLFIHGIPASALLWEDVLIEFVDKGYRVYAPDLPGYGHTRIDIDNETSEHLFSLEGSSSLIYAWLAEQNIGPVWLVAHDIGGGVGQIFTANYPEIVNHLTLSNCIASDLWPIPTISLLKVTAKLGLYDFFAGMGGMEHGLSWYKLRTSVSDESVMTKEVAEKVFWYDKVNNKNGRQQFSEHLKALSSEQLASYDQKLEGIRMPTLLAWATDDPNQPWEESGQKLKSLIKHSDVAFIDDAGHFFQLEKASEYANVLHKWRIGKLSNDNQIESKKVAKNEI